MTTAATSTIAPGSPRAWLLAARPKTLAAAFVPVFVGTAIAHRQDTLAWLPALAALLGSALLQIGSNLANDVFDYEKGADTEDRLGPTRAAQAGLLSPRALKLGMVVVFGLSLVVGSYLTWVAGWPIIAIGLASIVSAIAYTGGPYPLGYNGLGDLFVMMFFGFVAVPGTVFVQGGGAPLVAFVAAVPVGALATAILVVNNVRDVQGDAEVGKRTLAVRFGRRAGIGEYVALLAASYATPLALFVGFGFGPSIFLPCLTLPSGARRAKELATLEGEPLNATLEGTAKLLALFGLLFTVGIALS